MYRSSKRWENRLWCKTLFLLGFCFLFFFPGNQPLNASENDVLKDELQFAILLRIINFIEWPEYSGRIEEPIRIVVYAEDRICKSIKELLRKSSIADHIELVDFSKTEDDEHFWDTIDIVYFAHQKDPKSEELLEQLLCLPILLVGSEQGFLERGGTLNFIEENERIAFEIDTTNGAKTGISFRAKLLRLANKVVN